MGGVSDRMSSTVRRRSSTAAACAAVGALLLAACGGGDTTATTAETAATSPETVAEAPSANTGSLSATLASTTAVNTEIDLAALDGRDTVLWFWAPWCTVCRAEAPAINETAERFGDQIEIVGVAGRGELGDIQEFIDSTETGSIPHLADLEGGVWSTYGVFTQPSFAFVGDDGTVETFTGALGAEALGARIEEMIAS